MWWDSGRVYHVANPGTDYAHAMRAGYRVPFRDGMRVDRDGIPLDPEDLARVDHEIRYLSRRGRRLRRWAKGWETPDTLPLTDSPKETAAT